MTRNHANRTLPPPCHHLTTSPSCNLTLKINKKDLQDELDQLCDKYDTLDVRKGKKSLEARVRGITKGFIIREVSITIYLFLRNSSAPPLFLPPLVFLASLLPTLSSAPLPRHLSSAPLLFRHFRISFTCKILSSVEKNDLDFVLCMGDDVTGKLLKRKE